MRHALRTLLAATAAAAAAIATSASWSVVTRGDVLAATPTPSLSPAPPTPCPTGLPGLLCTIGGGPTVTPPPTPPPAPTTTPTPSHTATPSSTPQRSGPAAAAGATGPHPPSPSASASASATAPATLAAIAGRFSNAPFLQQLLDILAHPSAAQQPDLLHFRIPTQAAPAAAITGSGLPLTSAADPKPPAAPPPAPDHRSWSVIAALLAGLVAATLVSARTPGGRLVTQRLEARLRGAARFPGTRLSRLRMRTARGHRLQAAIVLATCPVVIAAAIAGAVAPARPAAAPVQPAAAAPLDAVGVQAASRGNAGSGYAATRASIPPGQPAADPLPVWTQLVGIEQGIATQQDALGAQEADLTRLARVAAISAGDDIVLPPMGSVDLAAVQQRLTTLVAAHDQTKALLQQSLQAEYSLYRGAAQDPAQKQQLVTGAGQAPEARQAVADDLGRIQTQLHQEQVIADARARLARIGDLTQKQLDAIQAHQAFVAPELAPVSQGFGPTDFSMEPPLSYGGVFYPHFHTGLDLSAPLGTPVHAAADGVVIVATASTDSTGHLAGYGNYAVIAHPAGFITLYGHLDSLAVKTGQFVHQGEIVGQEGSTGWSTGPHLHFEIRLGDQLLDPLAYVKSSLG